MTWRAIWVIALGVALSPAFASAAAAEGPAAYQANPAHDGAAAGTAFAPPLGKRWVRRDLGKGTSFPVIAEGKAFVAAGQILYALDLGSGATVWSRPIATTGVAYDNGRVFAVDNRGVMQALSAADGKKLWASQIAGSTSYFSAPTAYGDFVYVSGEDTIFGVRQADGIVVWAQSAGTSENTVPAVDSDKVYTAGGCGTTTALQRTVGAEVWNYSGECRGSNGSPSVALHGNHVYSGETAGASVIELDSLTGFLADNVAGRAPPAFAGDVGYYGGQHEIFARSESSGLVQWRRPLDREQSIVAPPLVAGDFVYAVTSERKVIALSRASGQLVWERALASTDYYSSSSDGPIYRLTGLAAAGNTLLVASGDRVTAFMPGPDTPGVDDPDKPPANGGSIGLEVSGNRTVFGKGVEVTANIEGISSSSGSMEIQADPWPYGAWEHLKDVPIDSSYLRFVLRPARNTRYRAVYAGTNPTIVSNELTLFSDVQLAFRVIARGRRRVLVKVSAAGPDDAGLRRRRVFVYHYRPRARFSRRIGSLRLRGKGTKAKGQRLLRTPTLRRTDLFFICRRERRDDGFGRPDKRLALCGRPRVR